MYPATLMSPNEKTIKKAEKTRFIWFWSDNFKFYILSLIGLSRNSRQVINMASTTLQFNFQIFKIGPSERTLSVFIGQITFNNQASKKSPRAEGVRLWDPQGAGCKPIRSLEWNFLKENYWLPWLLRRVRPCCQGITAWTSGSALRGHIVIRW
jgi:hypothetical protein